jgi:3-methyladenine DNA glycosylase/8-oxoguanine DNA glycosylase
MNAEVNGLFVAANLQDRATTKPGRIRRLPKPAEMETIAKVWSPYRTFACWYLWKSLDVKTM